MDRVDKTIALRQLGLGAIVVGITQQSRRHARPNCEHHERQQVADSHSPSSRFVEMRAGWGTWGPLFPGLQATTPALDKSIPRDSIVVKPDQEGNGARYVDEGVQPIDVHHEPRVRHEELLNGDLPEDVQSFLQIDELKGMTTGNMNCAFNECDRREGSSELVYLRSSGSASLHFSSRNSCTHPVYQCPVPGLNQERELVQHPTE